MDLTLYCHIEGSPENGLSFFVQRGALAHS